MNKEVRVRCTKDGISVEGARDIGSTSDTIVDSLSQFLRIAECWWNTYCEKFLRQETDCHGNAAAMRAALEIAHDYFNSGGTLRTDAAKAVEAALAVFTEAAENVNSESAIDTGVNKEAKPLRNCDVYRDYDSIHNAWVKSHGTGLAFGEWIFARAKNQKGDNDGK